MKLNSNYTSNWLRDHVVLKCKKENLSIMCSHFIFDWRLICLITLFISHIGAWFIVKCLNASKCVYLFIHYMFIFGICIIVSTVIRDAAQYFICCLCGGLFVE